MLFQDQSKIILDQTITELKSINATKERGMHVKLLDFYEGYQDQYLLNYGFFDIEKKQWKTPATSVNLTRKVINKTSLLYKKPPVRTLVINGKAVEKDKDQFEEWIKKGQGQYNVHFKWAERYKKLKHNVLYRPVFDTISKKWKYFIDTTFEPHFYRSDPLHPFGYSILISRDKEKEMDKEVWVFWSDTEYFFHDNNYKRWTKQIMSDGTVVDFKGENPFKIMPLIEFRLAPPISQWYSPGAVDLVNSNHSINVKLMEMNMGIRYQAFGIPWENSGADEKKVGNIVIGPDVIAHLPSGATLSNLDLNPKFVDIMTAIKDHIEIINRVYNININWNLQGSPASGFSLMVQNIDLMEDRVDDIDMAITAEKGMYQVIAKMQQFYNGIKQLPPDEPILPENAELSIDYAEIDFPINQAEELAMRDWNIEHNIKTPLDYMDSELSPEDKLKKFKENKKINGQLSQEEELAIELEEEGIVIGGNGEL
jgi:hypothetical protein